MSVVSLNISSILSCFNNLNLVQGVGDYVLLPYSLQYLGDSSVCRLLVEQLIGKVTFSSLGNFKRA